MKRKLQTIFACVIASQLTTAQITGTVAITGPSSSQPPYVLPLVSNATVTSIFTATDVIGGYTMCGTPDGLGAFDNGNGTFTLLMNHEFIQSVGVARAHGGTGAFVSKWIINKVPLSVVSGADLIQSVYLNSGGGYTLTPAVTFTRFCSGDLPAVSSFYNAATGLGTQNRIYMNGEESGTEGRAMAHVVNGVDAGKSYELPYLGKQAWENAVACPNTGTKTVVGLMDDTTPGQVYFYIGTKTNSGLDVDKAGLTNGKLYGVSVSSLAAETSSSFPTPNTTFTLIDLGQVNAITGASLNTMANNLGVTTFLRPEDGSWDPSSPRDFYFNTTNAFNSPSRLWKLRFTNIATPELGGVITAVMDGTEGQQMFDNMGIDNSGNIVLQEDVGNNAWNGRMLNYNIATDVITPIFQHDPTRFITGGVNFLTQDEETSGAIDVSAILGQGMFLTVDQAHYAIPGGVVEGGQLMAFYNPISAPEINMQGNSNDITYGASVTSPTNNTNYGLVNVGNAVINNFNIQNTGGGSLTISNVTITGANASEFSLTGVPALPFNMTQTSNIVFAIQFAPSAAGTRSAMVTINNNDYNEPSYSFVVAGTGSVVVVNTGIKSNASNNNSISLFPNPAKDEVTVKLNLEKNEHVVINVFDVLGKKCIVTVEKDLEKGEQQVSLNTSLLSNGEYFVKVNVGVNSTRMKLIINH